MDAISNANCYEVNTISKLQKKTNSSRLKKKILILYTGGTMGMRHKEDGSLGPEKGYLTERILELPEMLRSEMPLFDIIEYDPLLDSSCMGPSEWTKIATDIEANYNAYDGFVIIMGTDTMAYCASALSFMLEHLGKPVIFTGSQIPFCEVYNDAQRNLIVSVIFACNNDFNEVCICFNDKLLRANRTIKVNSVGLNAFDSPNFPPLATLGAFLQNNTELALPKPTKPFRAHKFLDAKVIVLKLVPGFDDECIYAMVMHSRLLKGIILELYGTGNGPTNKLSLLQALELAKQKNIVVAAVSQCLHGGVSLDTYSIGREFKRVGVISAGDMTTEACSTKLSYILGLGISNLEEIAEMITNPIRGEITLSGKIKRKFFNHDTDGFRSD